MNHLMLVAVGGATGAVARWWLATLIQQRGGLPGFPIGTLVVNLIGCLLAGVLAGVVVRNAAFSQELRLLLMTGVLGGFTTFSAFGRETVDLLQRGAFASALLYVALSVAGGVVVLWVAMAVVVRVSRRDGAGY